MTKRSRDHELGASIRHGRRTPAANAIGGSVDAGTGSSCVMWSGMEFAPGASIDEADGCRDNGVTPTFGVRAQFDE